MKRTVKTKVIAPWSKCTFSKNPEYRKLTVEELYKINPRYIKWCIKNLNSLSWKLVKKYTIESSIV